MSLSLKAKLNFWNLTPVCLNNFLLSEIILIQVRFLFLSAILSRNGSSLMKLFLIFHLKAGWWITNSTQLCFVWLFNFSLQANLFYEITTSSHAKTSFWKDPMSAGSVWKHEGKIHQRFNLISYHAKNSWEWVTIVSIVEWERSLICFMEV